MPVVNSPASKPGHEIYAPSLQLLLSPATGDCFENQAHKSEHITKAYIQNEHNTKPHRWLFTSWVYKPISPFAFFVHLEGTELLPRDEDGGVLLTPCCPMSDLMTTKAFATLLYSCMQKRGANTPRPFGVIFIVALDQLIPPPVLMNAKTAADTFKERTTRFLFC